MGVQHHAAHVFACLADNELQGEVLGVSWDGTGLGTDGTIWGGEFLRVRDGEFRRVAHLRTFLLAGGDAAAREPRRCALGLNDGGIALGQLVAAAFRARGASLSNGLHSAR